MLCTSSCCCGSVWAENSPLQARSLCEMAAAVFAVLLRLRAGLACAWLLLCAPDALPGQDVVCWGHRESACKAAAGPRCRQGSHVHSARPQYVLLRLDAFMATVCLLQPSTAATRDVWPG